MMAQKIVIKKIRSPAPDDLDEDIDFICKSLGYFSKRDRQETAGSIFRLLVRISSNSDQGLTSDEIAEELNLTRGAIVYHLNSFMKSGIVIKENRYYRLRSASMQKSLEEIKTDFERIMKQMIKISMDIDKRLGNYYR
jgi:predicted transcriptional regulator